MINRASRRATATSPPSHSSNGSAGTRFRWPEPAELPDLPVPVPASPDLPVWFGLKYKLDRVLAVLLLIPALPVMLGAGILVRITSPGPALYRQRRVGLNGRVFNMYKIRTMVVDAEAGSGPVWSTGADPRVTRVGRWLRFLHIDELPQLFNVLRGQMSLIGPRPERPDFVRVLSSEIGDYPARLMARPGITGLAQIYLPPDETLDCVRKKVCFDRAYIESASPIVDLQILLCTAIRILGVRKGRGPRLAGLDQRFAETKALCEQWSAREPETSGSSTDHRPIPGNILREDAANSNGHHSNGHHHDSLTGSAPRLPR